MVITRQFVLKYMHINSGYLLIISFYYMTIRKLHRAEIASLRDAAGRLFSSLSKASSELCGQPFCYFSLCGGTGSVTENVPRLYMVLRAIVIRVMSFHVQV